MSNETDFKRDMLAVLNRIADSMDEIVTNLESIASYSCGIEDATYGGIQDRLSEIKKAIDGIG